jgi:copper resistance protein B
MKRSRDIDAQPQLRAIRAGHASMRRNRLLLACALAANAPFALAQHSHSPASAQEPARAPATSTTRAYDEHQDHAGHTKPAKQVDHSAHAVHSGHTAHSNHAGHSDHADHSGHAGHTGHTDHSNHTPTQTPQAHTGHRDAGSATHSETAPKEPIPPVTDADRAAAFPAVGAHAMHGDGIVAMLVVDRLEAWSDHGERGQHWELQGWVDGDLHRVWLRSAGEREDGRTESADLEVLYGRSVTAWWDVVAGVRHERVSGLSREWAALGVQGMSPYKFEIEATAYLGSDGRSAAQFEAEYDVLLSNRLILQPVIELEFQDRRDRRRDTGAGLVKAEAGLRLRYEFTRRFAPYLGVVHERSEAADGGQTRENRVVGGVRMWF